MILIVSISIKQCLLTQIIHEINFEAILGTSLKVIYVYFAGLVTTNRTKLTQNLSTILTPKLGVFKTPIY